MSKRKRPLDETTQITSSALFSRERLLTVTEIKKMRIIASLWDLSDYAHDL
jgi:hypothetical protein